ncbi:MAG: SlyX family protein [Treponemataceae bacterium]
MDSYDIDERFGAIEIKLAYIEDFLNRLHDQILQRNASTDRLTTEHAAMKEKLAQLASEMEEIPNKKPPHY